MFYPSVIEDHATRSSVKIRPETENLFSGSSSMDVFTEKKRGRTAKRRVQGTPHQSAKERVEHRQVEPFWQVAPDGETIERTYDPDQEPLTI